MAPIKTRISLLSLSTVLLLTVLALPVAAQSLPLPGLVGRLFFMSDRDGGLGIYVIHLNTGETERVIDLKALGFYSASGLDVSPDGSRLAFDGLVGSWWDHYRQEVYTVNVDGSGFRQLTDWPTRTAEYHARWSPNEPEVLYYIHDFDWRDGTYDELRRLDLATGEDSSVPQTPFSYWFFDFTPDGEGVVFNGEQGPGSHPHESSLWYMSKTDGSTRLIRAANGLGDFGVPRVNRGDGWIVYYEELAQRQPGAIYKMDADGNSVQLLAAPGIPGFDGDWGGFDSEGYLFLVARVDGDTGIFVMEARPGAWPASAINLTNAPGTEWSPAWTPIPATPADSTPPQISWIIEGTLAGNGWYTSDVAVTWSVTDPESAFTTEGCNAQSVTEDTAGTTFTCTARSAGGTTSESVTIKRDTTPPTVACSVTPTVLWPANHKLWDVTATATASDANAWTLKGLEILGSEADSGLGKDDVPNDIQGFAADMTTSGQLRAERYSKAGRTYTISFTVADDAGNTGTCATSVTVPHDQGKANGKKK